ncbi:MAG: hypothetical protein MJZ24_00945 [Paludibacteraceae bacterium]|nr:hypothetical protein [Paludibacteraceae bacterium]
MKIQKITLKNGEIISIPFPENYSDCFTLVKSDQYRNLGKIPSTLSIWKQMILHPCSNPLVWFRMCKHKGFFFRICRFFYKRSSIRYNLDIPIQTRVGYGFYIGHGMCIVINIDTIIGNNVNVSQFLNIGTNHSKPAVIADNVYVGPSVCIVEDVQIGSNSTIGAGAVVTKDIPENATCAGVPSKVLNFNMPGRYIKNKWNN